MKILFTHSKLPLSKFIMWGLNEPVSHVAIEFEGVNGMGGLVFHSNLLGAHVEFKESFYDNCVVVKSLKLNLLGYDEWVIYKTIVTNYRHKEYDFKAFFYFCWRGFLHRFFKIPFPEKNKFESSGLLCTEVLDCLRQYVEIPENLSMKSPFFLMNVLMNQPNIEAKEV